MGIHKKAHLVRTRAGSPPFLLGGSKKGIIGSLYLFWNPAALGMYYDAEALGDNPVDQAKKHTYYTLLPKAIMASLSSGVALAGVVALRKALSAPGSEEDKKLEQVQKFLEWQKIAYHYIPEHDKANYTVISFGLTPDNHVVYLRIPMDENMRLVGGTAWKLMNGSKVGAASMASHILDFAGGQVPSLSPALEALFTLSSVAQGKNPYDSFRGRERFDPQVVEAGGTRYYKDIAKELSNMLGGGVIYRFRSQDQVEYGQEITEFTGLPKGYAETMGKVVAVSEQPIAQNVVGRFLKVSDYGGVQQFTEAAQPVRAQKAASNLKVRAAVKRKIEGNPKDSDAALLNANPKYAKYWEKRAETRGRGAAIDRALIGKSRAQKEVMIDDWEKLHGIPYEGDNRPKPKSRYKKRKKRKAHR